MGKILAIGNALVDLLIRLPSDDLLSRFALQKGSMQLCDITLTQEIQAVTEDLEKHKASGGSSANTVHGLARLGIPVGYIGKVGKDEFGSFFRDDMHNHAIETQLAISNTPTGIATALISPDSERTFATYLGAAVELSPDEITEEMLGGYEYLYLEGYLVFNNELMLKALSLAKKMKLKSIIDLASFNVVAANKDFLLDVISKYIHIVFANEEEAKALTGNDPEDALYDISKICDIAVVKIGKDGSFIKKKNKYYRAEGKLAHAIDTTGAGDLYASGFLYGLLNGMPLETCGRIGSITAGNVVEVLGAKMDDSRWEKIISEIKNIR